VAHIARLPRLESLSMPGAQTEDGDPLPAKYGDKAMQALSKSKTIRHLNISTSLITDIGLAHLKTLPQLEVLNIAYTRVTDDGVEHLSEMKQLRELTSGLLFGQRISNDAVESLKRLRPTLRVNGALTPGDPFR
jgi:hypothetical protein